MSGRIVRPGVPRPASALGAQRVLAWIRWFGPGRVAAGVVLVACVIVGVWWGSGASSGGGPPSGWAEPPHAARHTLVAPASNASATGEEPPEERLDRESDAASVPLVVHVAGAVTRPGLVSIAAGSRVAEAIDAAGGPTTDADLDSMNLAALVADGQRIRVTRVGEAPEPMFGDPGSVSDHHGPWRLVDINRADATELQRLPGIGPVLASAIIEERRRNGLFEAPEDLLRVRGIGPTRLAALRDLVVV